jgi:hypothetical protein
MCALPSRQTLRSRIADTSLHDTVARIPVTYP